MDRRYLRLLWLGVVLLVISSACVPVYRLGNGGMRLGPVEVQLETANRAAPIFQRHGEYYAVGQKTPLEKVHIRNRTKTQLSVFVQLEDAANKNPVTKKLVLKPQQKVTLANPKGFSKSHFKKVQVAVYKPTSQSTSNPVQKIQLEYNDCKGYKANQICPRWCFCHHLNTKKKQRTKPDNDIGVFISGRF